MSDLTDTGARAIADLAMRYNLSTDAVEAMARAVAQGGGTMAQFNIPELGGSGQWMAGGMTMVGDMFNTGLQNTVSGLCVELSNAMANALFFVPPAPARPWWPEALGQPAATGGQNAMRYAYFPQARRLAIDPGDGTALRVLDTLDHQIGGFSQQQSGPGDPFIGLTFSSQYGMYAVSSLPPAPVGQGEGQPATPAPPAGPPPGHAPARTQVQFMGGGGQSQSQGVYPSAPFAETTPPLEQPTRPASVAAPAPEPEPKPEPEHAAAPSTLQPAAAAPQHPPAQEPPAQEPPAQEPPAQEPPSAEEPRAEEPPSAAPDAEPVAAPTGETSADVAAIIDTIGRLAALRDAGALTEEEFVAKKIELLSRI